MEKYLRLLNPKTTNFESTVGGFGALTTQDICAAISFSGLTELQSILLELHLKHVQLNDLRKIAEHIAEIERYRDDSIVIYVALVEIFNSLPGYKPSVRNRKTIADVTYHQIQSKLGTRIDFFKERFHFEIKEIEQKIFAQLKK